MICPNCGENLSATDKVCRVCGWSVNQDSVPQINNPAVTPFKQPQDTNEPNYEINQNDIKDYYYEPKPTERDNTKYNKIDENNRLKATIINAIELVVIISVFLIIMYILYQFIFSNQ